MFVFLLYKMLEIIFEFTTHLAEVCKNYNWNIFPQILKIF